MKIVIKKNILDDKVWLLFCNIVFLSLFESRPSQMSLIIDFNWCAAGDREFSVAQGKIKNTETA